MAIAGPVQSTSAPRNPKVFEANIALIVLGALSRLGEAALAAPEEVTGNRMGDSICCSWSVSQRRS